MWYKHLIEERIALEKVLNQKCYWWVLIQDAHLCIHIKGKMMNIKLPTPVVLGRADWHEEWKYKERNDAEIARCKAIWSGLTVAIQDKLQRIEAGESTVEEEFKDGIFFEDGKYGLKYKESWPL